VTAFSYQGISDKVAQQYMVEHGIATWADIEANLRRSPSCPKLRAYWAYEACRYDRALHLFRARAHDACPVPSPPTQWQAQPDRLQPLPVHSRHRGR
jgi:hypothetical protein